MDRFFHGKNKREAIFIIISLVLFSLLTIYVVFSFTFLANKMNETVNINLIKNPEIVKFNFDKLEKLKK